MPRLIRLVNWKSWDGWDNGILQYKTTETQQNGHKHQACGRKVISPCRDIEETSVSLPLSWLGKRPTVLFACISVFLSLLLVPIH